MIKDELDGQIMIKFVALSQKAYSYLMYDGNSDKKAKGTKKCLIKRELKFKNYKDCNKEINLITIKYLEKKMGLTLMFKQELWRIYKKEEIRY